MFRRSHTCLVVLAVAAAGCSGNDESSSDASTPMGIWCESFEDLSAAVGDLKGLEPESASAEEYTARVEAVKLAWDRFFESADDEEILTSGVDIGPLEGASGLFEDAVDHPPSGSSDARLAALSNEIASFETALDQVSQMLECES